MKFHWYQNTPTEWTLCRATSNTTVLHEIAKVTQLASGFWWVEGTAPSMTFLHVAGAKQAAVHRAIQLRVEALATQNEEIQALLHFNQENPWSGV